MKIAVLGVYHTLGLPLVRHLATTLPSTVTVQFYDEPQYANRIVEYAGEEVLVQSIDNLQVEDADIYINLITSSKTKEISLAAEDLCKLTIDASRNFIEDTTIPVKLLEQDFCEFKNAKIIRIPSNLVSLLSPILSELNKVYSVKKFNIYIYEPASYEDFNLAEEILCTDISEISSYNGRLSAAIIPLEHSDVGLIHLNVELSRPFNQDDIIQRLKNLHIQLHHTTRDLSVDSGVNIWLKATMHQKKKIGIISQIIENSLKE